MKFLLAAINAKYIHSNLGVYSLKQYAQAHHLGADIEIGEYTINHQMEHILKDIYIRKPDVIGFSCYIWNISYVEELIHDLENVLPDVPVWLGGPEVSFCAADMLEREPNIYGIMIGEGERTFASLLEAYEAAWKAPGSFDKEKLAERLSSIPGLAYRGQEGDVLITPPGPVMNMDDIPFSYQDLKGFENRIIYYESSRGCPFSCSYCLSSIDKSVRFRSLELVKKELDFFLEHQVPQVKFVDRTFNCRKDHAMAIWKHIADHDNGITNFHFEISADLLDEDELLLLGTLRPGLVQLEIGVQTANLQTIHEIRRKTDLNRLKEVVARIKKGHNIHQHLDLIAGLPFEDYSSFKRSFCQVYEMEPDELQLGFLKVLKGSYMAEKAADYGLLCRQSPPYEVLCTNWMSYGDILRLKGVEEMVEVYYNSRQFIHTTAALAGEFDSPFDMFESLAQYYEMEKLYEVRHNRTARYEILYRFLCSLRNMTASRLKKFRDLLIYDLYLRENVKSRPDFAADQTQFKNDIKPYYDDYCRAHRQKDKRMVHIEVMEDGRYILFDYEVRDPLTYNGTARTIQRKQETEMSTEK
ncbi:B12-binding domain-containing radical SAM protein [Clostridium sp. AM58-1XD]|uniref:B12-binding domain-containing radical SAM protein n=1 Tax=Clostridium sp. AM58-1XD TaxID=2292307 RepID=UPI000E4E7DBE|nr:B12-binding domain-containing radical SAM protein [Clostridium sp. AM58-1XD]RGZ01262.1 DUF4080 domain-containing protein [Clostridium sp. AM58-1XD]